MLELYTNANTNWTPANGRPWPKPKTPFKASSSRSAKDTRSIPSPGQEQLTTREDTNKKMRKWAENTRTAHLDCTAVWLNITTMLIWQIYNVLPATTLMPHQCKRIMWPCLSNGLAVAGYSWSFPWAIIHALYKYYGLNLTDMHTKQGIQHILAVLQFGHSSDDLTGRLIHGSTKTLTLELGTPANPFTLNFKMMHTLVTNAWIKTVWQFQKSHNIQIKTDLPNLEPLQANNQFLIPSFMQVGIQGAKLAQINRCCLYLQVTTLADICDISGE